MKSAFNQNQRQPVPQPRVRLRIAGVHFEHLRQHLFPGDGKEAVALALCGVAEGPSGSPGDHVLTVHSVVPVPYELCSLRASDALEWSTALLPTLLLDAERKGMRLLKVHSHTGEWPYFSQIDDYSDHLLFPGVAGWLDTDEPGISAILLPSCRVLARAVDATGRFGCVESVLVAGHDINVYYPEGNADNGERYTVPANVQRLGQAFGAGTVEQLARLSIGVVGCSGTGSATAMMLARLGAGELVLVDDDRVKIENLDRIWHATRQDAAEQRHKTEVLADAIRSIGLGNQVVSVVQNVLEPQVVRRLSHCDIIFGCVDNVEARHLLNQLCTHYVIPYFDMGSRINPDGHGSVDQVCGTVHYVQPGGSSLLSRDAYTLETLRAEGLRRTDPEAYREQVAHGYLHGTHNDRPAVICTNTLFASLAVTEFLARIHPFRNQPNDAYGAVGLNLMEMWMQLTPEDKPCATLVKYVGRGDCRPLLNRPDLSERQLLPLTISEDVGCN